jgi:transcription initiation factor TFIIIB Brf1 subunit/transcription initiation factor TFIIB
MEVLFPRIHAGPTTALADEAAGGCGAGIAKATPFCGGGRIMEPIRALFEEAKPLSDIDIDTCPHCKMQDCFDASELLSCKSCGHVISRPFDSSAEYRFFSNDDRGGDPTRVGAPQDPTLPQASLGTVILGGYGGTKSMYKVRKYHSWNAVPYKERSLIQANERLALIGLNHGINHSVIDPARAMYITIKEVGGRQGLSKDAMLAGCLYLALKGSGSPRKPKDVADMFGLTSATFTKALKQLQEILAMARQKGLLGGAIMAPKSDEKGEEVGRGAGAVGVAGVTMKASVPVGAAAKARVVCPSTKATEYIALPLSRLPLPRVQMEHLTVLCTRLAEKVEELGLAQESMPPSLAAGCIAFVVKRTEGVELTLPQLAEVSDISVATLQKCVRRLELKAGELEEIFS